jgi:cellulose biosynthesis protein BcsQ
VICTFYSYKGGVGRSMALAKSADVLARAGLRVLMIDFDLEAPGLEQYFDIDKKAVRAHTGLFDLILHYKAAMASSLPASQQDQDFRDLDRLFIIPVYTKLPSGGKLDLMPAGQRGSDEQLSEYALGLRQFDWQDFYFNFGGEVFFEWLRRSLMGDRYDIVLVDSRTGVTEMGGICAYQLADTIIVMCAPNQQNLDGTRDVVHNFSSLRVLKLRGGRPLRLVVVPSRVEMREENALNDFHDQFENLFAGLTPKELEQGGLTYWDLLIPYDPRSAFQEAMVPHDTRAGARSTINPAIQKLVRAICLLAEPGDPVHGLGAGESAMAAVTQAQYDVTSRGAGYDIFLAYQKEDAVAAESIARSLTKIGLRVYFDRREMSAGEDFQLAERRALQQSNACALIVGPSGNYPWHSEYLRQLLVDRGRATPLHLVPVLLPGAILPSSDVVPKFLVGLKWVRLNDLDADQLHQLADAANADTDQKRATTQLASVGSPYKGLVPFDEADAPIFFGRDELISRITRNLEDTRFLVVIGPSGSGKTSVILAGVIPALRRGAVPGSDRWHYVVIKPGSKPVQALFDSVTSVTPGAVAHNITDLENYLDHSNNRYLVVIDQFEEIFVSPEANFAEMKDYIQTLLVLITKWKKRLAIILVVRSDQLNRLMEFAPPWANLVESNIVFVGPMGQDEMRKAIEAPAQYAGLAIEAGLTDLILHDAMGAPGALPLMQYVLRELWERSQQGYLTVAAYHEIGGVTGSLERDAEAYFARLPDADRDLAMAILLRLVRVTVDGAFIRRVASLDELASMGPTDDIRRILDALVAARLVVVSSEQGSQSWVDLAHDSIISSWGRFRDQIEQRSQFLRLRTKLEVAVQQWEEHKRDAGFLYPEGEILLLKSEGMLERYKNELSVPDQEFINASEQVLVRRRRRNRIVTIALALLTIMMTTTGLFAVFQLREAVDQRNEALMQKALAERSESEADAQRRKAEQASIEVKRQTKIADQAAIQAGVETRLAAIANLSAASAISPDGRRMLLIEPNGVLSIVDLATGNPVFRIADASHGITAAAFSPDASIATGTIDGSVSVYDSTLRQLRTQVGHHSAVRRIAFSPDGRAIASGSDDATAIIWSADSGMAVGEPIVADGPVVGVAFSPDGARLIITSQKGTLYIVDARTGRIIN